MRVFLLSFIGVLAWIWLEPPAAWWIWTLGSGLILAVAMVADRCWNEHLVQDLRLSIAALDAQLTNHVSEYATRQRAREVRRGSQAVASVVSACERADRSVGQTLPDPSRGVANAAFQASRVMPVVAPAVLLAAVAYGAVKAGPKLGAVVAKGVQRLIVGTEPKSGEHERLERERSEHQAELESLEAGLGCSSVLAMLAVVIGGACLYIRQ